MDKYCFLFVIVIVVFLAFREVNLWYFKINQSIELQRESLRLLKIIAGDNSVIEKKSNGDTKETVYRETKDHKILKITSTNNITIGAEVFIEDEIAPDGKYEYLNDNRILIIKNGKITKLIA